MNKDRGPLSRKQRAPYRRMAVGTRVKLECYTAELRYSISEVSPDYCKDTYSLEIVNPYPSETKVKDVFEVFCQAPPQPPLVNLEAGGIDPELLVSGGNIPQEAD